MAQRHPAQRAEGVELNFYNEHDPKAAAWLRALMAAGLIPPGDVDERSITEIKPHELSAYTQCHFFAGIGGWSLALELAGWPASRPVGTGSCPCQPFSAAGKQLGTADARHLWPVFFALIRACRELGQQWAFTVFGEQVANAIGKGWLDGISADLEGAGYACGATVLGAHSVGAPHIRQRLYWVADAAGASGPEQRDEPRRGARRGPSSPDAAEYSGSCDRLADARSVRCNTGLTGDGRSEEGTRGEHGESVDRRGGMADTSSAGCQGAERNRQAGTEGRPSGYTCERGSNCRLVLPVCTRLEGHAGHGDNGDEPGRLDADAAGPVAEASGLVPANGRGLPGNTSGLPDASGDVGGSGQHEPERSAEGRASDRRTDAWSRFDLIPCADGKARRIEPGLAPLAHGIPARVVRLRGYGNAIVPQVAAEFVQAFCEARA